MKEMKFEAYGKRIEILKLSENWVAFYLGNEYKKRIADDIWIHSELKEEEIHNLSKRFSGPAKAGALNSTLNSKDH